MTLTDQRWAFTSKQYNSGYNQHVIVDSRQALSTHHQYGPGDDNGSCQLVDVGNTQFSTGQGVAVGATYLF